MAGHAGIARPESLGKWRTISGWFDLWNANGTLQKVVDRLTHLVIDQGDLSSELWCIDGDGEPVAWPVFVAGDKGSRADWIDESLLDLQIISVIPSKENEARVARPVDFEPERSRQRHIVERVIGWRKEYRRVFSRFEKTAKNFDGMLRIALTQRDMRALFGESLFSNRA